MLQNINGYWEIAQIETTDGQVKEFAMSQNIDFFEINDNGKGIRKKVQPNIQGTFTTAKTSENIDVISYKKELTLQYSTALDIWTETVQKATENKLVLINEAGIIYTYKKYKPLVIN